MALDSKLTQTLNIRTDASNLVRPLDAMANKLNRLVKQMEQVANPSTKKGQAELNQLLKMFDRVAKQAKTINDLMENGSRSGRNRNSLLGGLDEQKLGKTVLSASKLRQELKNTTNAADALELRLASIYKKIGELGKAGRTAGGRDIAKALGTEEALKQVRTLEREIQRLDNRAKARGGLSAEGTSIRAELQKAQADLLNRVKAGRRVDFTAEITQINQLVDSYRKLTKAEIDAASIAERAAMRRRSAVLDQANMNEAQLRAAINRGAGRYSFTRDEAKGFNGKALEAQIASGTSQLVRFQQAMNNAIAQNRGQPVIDRLAKSFENLRERISEATAKKKAFDQLPAQRMKAMTEGMFSDGAWMPFGARIMGAGLLASAGFAALNAAQDSARYVVQLEDALARLQAISGATDPEMKKLSTSIVELGTTSRYSTLEIAEAATQIVQAGYSAAEAGDVLQASLMLASGSGSTVAEGVDTMTSSLGAFQLQASEAGRVSDILMEGLNRSKLSITQMQAALQYAGATAKETGMDLSELVAIAGSLANAGIRNGSTIGTGVRQLIVDLQTPTEKFQKELKSLGLTMADVDIRSQSLADVVKKLTDAGFTAEGAYESFEVRAASAFLAFRNQIDVYDEMSVALTQTGAAAAANARAMDSLSAKWTQTKNTLGELLAMLSQPFINALKVVLDTVTSVVGGITDFINEVAKATGASGEWGTVLSGALLPALLGFAVGGPIGAVIAGLIGLVGGMKDASDASEELAAATDQSKQELAASRQTIMSVDEAIDRLVQRGDSLKKNHTALQVEVLNLTNRFEGLATQLDASKLGYEELMDAMVRYRGLALQEEAEKARKVVNDSIAQGKPVLERLYGGVQPMITQARNLNKHGPAQYRGSAALKSYESYATSTNGKRYDQLSGEGILAEQVTLRGLIEDLRELGQGNAYINAAIARLQERLNLVQQLGELRGNITQAIITQDMAAEIGSPEGQARDSFLLKTKQAVTEGLNKNKDKQGSGDAILNTAMNQAYVEIKNMEAELAKAAPDSAKARAIGQSLTDLRAEISRVTRASDRATEAMLKDEKAGPGGALDSGQVKNLIESEFKGSKVTSWKKRDMATQRRLYANYIAGRGPKAAKPGESHHGNGRAIDMLPIPGMAIDDVAAFLESRGLEIIERLVETNPKTGVKHWHFAWKPKTSNYQKGLDREQDKAARELEKLLELRAENRTGAAEARIKAIINEGKAGMTDVGTASLEMDDTLEEFSAARMAEFDAKNPTAGKSQTELAIIADARKKYAEETEQKMRDYWAQFYRQIADQASIALQEALSTADTALEDAQYANDAPVRSAESDLTALGNRTNRNKFGAGTAYLAERTLEASQIERDKNNVAALQANIVAYERAIDDYNTKINSLVENSEEYKKAIAERDAALKAKNDTMRQTAELQQAINDKERDYTNIPLGQKLEGAAQAWLENSGAMDDWQKIAEDNVGPALDTLTNGFQQFFMDMLSGEKSFKQALGSMLKTFAMFVLQMITRALALMAVKAILTAIGVSPSGSYEGGPTGPAEGQPGGFGDVGLAPAFNGGPVVPVGRRYNGGTVNKLWGGGNVRTGVSTRDSSLYELAHGEYVVRNKSVRDLGIPFMESINKHGRKGLEKMGMAGGGFMNIQQPKQETNVFVVRPDSKPPMGPNDVLVTIHEDILQGGATKKLIKRVAQGG